MMKTNQLMGNHVGERDLKYNTIDFSFKNSVQSVSRSGSEDSKIIFSLIEDERQ